MFVCMQMYPVSGSAIALAGYAGLVMDDRGDLAIDECARCGVPLVGVTLWSARSGVFS